MKIVYTIERYKEDNTYLSLWKKGDIRTVSLRKIHDICCKAMQEALDERFINFGEYEHDFINKNNDINIFKCSPYPEGPVWDSMPIKYCPFCGKEIILQEE